MMRKLALRYLSSEKGRAIFDLSALTAVFVLIAVVLIYRAQIDSLRERETSSTLLVFAKSSVLDQMPRAARTAIGGTPGLGEVAWATRFGAFLDDGLIEVPAFAVSDNYIALDRSIDLSPQQYAQWRACKECVLVGADLMALRGWRVGQTINLRSDTWLRRAGEPEWPLKISGFIRDRREGIPAAVAYLHYDYLNDGRTSQLDTVGMFLVHASDPARAKSLASAIDERMERGSVPTWTVPQDATNLQLADRMRGVAAIMAVTAAILLASLSVIVANSFYWFAERKRLDIRSLMAAGLSKLQVIAVFAGRNLLVAGSASLLAGIVAASFESQLFPGTALSTIGRWLPSFLASALAVGALLAAAPPVLLIARENAKMTQDDAE